MTKVFTIAAYIAFAFWIASLVFLGFTFRSIDGTAGRFILEMATISVFGMAILLSVRKRSV